MTWLWRPLYLTRSDSARAATTLVAPIGDLDGVVDLGRGRAALWGVAVSIGSAQGERGDTLPRRKPRSAFAPQQDYVVGVVEG